MAKKTGKDATTEGTATRIAALRSRSPNNSNLAGIAQANPDRNLSQKAKEFVRLWASGESILSASHRAGYSDNGIFCYRLAKDPAVLKLYNAEKLKYEEASHMTRKRVMDGLLEGIAMAKLMSEPASMIAGWREVGKMCGYYEPRKSKIEINVSGNVTVKQLEGLPDHELLKLVRGEVEDVEFEEVEDE